MNRFSFLPFRSLPGQRCSCRAPSCPCKWRRASKLQMGTRGSVESGTVEMVNIIVAQPPTRTLSPHARTHTHTLSLSLSLCFSVSISLWRTLTHLTDRETDRETDKNLPGESRAVCKRRQPLDLSCSSSRTPGGTRGTPYEEWYKAGRN